MKDAQEISKARQKIGKKLVEAVARACSACKLAVKTDESERTTQTIRPVTLLTSNKKLDALPQRMAETLEMGKKRNGKRSFSYTSDDYRLIRLYTIAIYSITLQINFLTREMKSLKARRIFLTREEERI